MNKLFDLEEVPLFPPQPRAKKRKSDGDARFRGEYPPDWKTCQTCGGDGRVFAPWPDFHKTGESIMVDMLGRYREPCPDCKGMGSVKARVRYEAGFRCLRCQHPYVPKADAEKLRWLVQRGIEDVVPDPSWQEGGWSKCDFLCDHAGPCRMWTSTGPRSATPLFETEGWADYSPADGATLRAALDISEIQAAWRVLTVHHLDGDKGNLRWWNLASLCQRCHLEVQAKVVMERVYPFEHSAWFKPLVAGYYAWVYLGEELTRDETEARMDELLALEFVTA